MNDMEKLFSTDDKEELKEKNENLNNMKVEYNTDLGNWYTLQVHFGSEIAVEEQIKERAKLFHFEDRLSYVLVPKKILISATGKHLVKAIYAGYAFVQIKDIDNEIITAITSLPKVSRFIGNNLDKKKSDGKPTEVFKEDIMKVIEHYNKPMKTEYRISFEKGDLIRIKEGEFLGFQAVVENFDKDRQVLELSVKVFNRSTILKGIDAKTVEKIEE